MIVVEPMIVWNYKGFHLLVSFQNAINCTGKAHKELMKFYLPKIDSMTMLHSDGLYSIDAQKKEPDACKARQRIAQLGGVKQSWVEKSNPADCKATEFYSSSSGYVCFGTKKIENSQLGGNVAVVCNTEFSAEKSGVELTSDDIKTYQTLNLKNGDTLYNYDVKKDKFKKVADKNKHKKGRLGVTDEKDVNRHSIVYSGVYTYKPVSKRGYKRVYNVSDVKQKLVEDSKKTVRKLKLTWKTDDISCDDTDWDIGKCYIAKDVVFGSYNKKSSEPVAKYVNSHLASYESRR